MSILAIESSCDETSAAVIKKSKVLSNIISSQYFHSKYGGVVPELASRAHLEAVSAITNEALEKANNRIEDIRAIAVTSEPGLIGSLIVGSNFAKGLSLKYGLPIIPVNHIEGHIYSGCLQDGTVGFPHISLVVSGGHTSIFLVNSYSSYKVIGSTRDDAAGEAFDKIAKILGFPYPGGPQIDKFSKKGNPDAYDFPRSMINSPNFDFSFSGLKTSVRYYIDKHFPDGVPKEFIADVAASVQQAIVDVLVSKTVRAAKEHLPNESENNVIVIAGGVSANSELRRKMAEEASKIGIRTVAPELEYSMDNAAMIGFIAEKKIENAETNSFNDLKYSVNASALRAKRK
jgi:N6-L-threonylcarbamoyladenine synthase